MEFVLLADAAFLCWAARSPTYVEDVIVTKLRWCKEGRRTKDYQDVADVLAVYTGDIDWTYVRQWCQQHQTWDLLNQLRSSGPSI
jgi:hypothetical protein